MKISKVQLTITAGLILLCLLSCVTYQSDVTINRPKADVQEAIAQAESNLGTANSLVTGGYVLGTGYFLTPHNIRMEGEDTAFTLPGNVYFQSHLIEIQRRALLQELYVMEGNSIPPNPPEFKKKNILAPLGLYFVNLGLAYNYIYDHNAFLGKEIIQRNKPVIILIGVIDGVSTVLAAGGLIGTLLTDDEDLLNTFSLVAVTGLYSWLSLRASFSYDLIDKSFDFCIYHNSLLKSGYNWDPNFNVQDYSDLRYYISHNQIK